MAYPEFDPFETTVVTDDTQRIPLARVLKQHLPDWTWSQVRGLCKSGRVRVDGRTIYDARRQVDAGAHVMVTTRPFEERLAAVWADFRIVAEDEYVVVVQKPAGISTVPHEAGSRLTVQELIKRSWRAQYGEHAKGTLFVVHRLPADVSGLLVLARDPRARTALSGQARTRVMHPEFIAVVHGRIARDRFTIGTRIAADRGDGKRGSVQPPHAGKEAITHVEVVERLGSATVIRCAMETNRTHQVRIHLAEAGHPVLGETQYLDDYDGPVVPAPRLALHASRLMFKHPRTGRVVRYFAPPPADLSRLVTELGGDQNKLSGWGGRHEGRGRPNDPTLRKWWEHAGEVRRVRPRPEPRRASEPPRQPAGSTPGTPRDGDPSGTAPKSAPGEHRRKRVRPPRVSAAQARRERVRKLEQLKADIEKLTSGPRRRSTKRRK